MAHRFTIGVEEEFQIIDPATCALRSHVMQLVSAASPDIVEQVKHEMHQSIVETGTRICENVGELRIEMHRTRGELVAAAERVGLQVAAAGTHPFSSWIDQVISPGERYEHIVEELQQLARSLLDLRHARSRRHARQADHHRHDEHGPLFPSALARSLD